MNHNELPVNPLIFFLPLMLILSPRSLSWSCTPLSSLPTATHPLSKRLPKTILLLGNKRKTKKSYQTSHNETGLKLELRSIYIHTI